MPRPAPFDYVAATSVHQAITHLRTAEGAVLLAGGQSLMPAINTRALRPRLVVDINGIGTATGYTVTDGVLRLGALTRHRELELDARLALAAPLLSQAARLLGDPGVRRRGTLGGSLVQASPGAELPVACLVLDAQIEVVGLGKSRMVSAASLSLDAKTAVRSDEIVTAVTVPVATGAQGHAVHEYRAAKHGVNVVAAARVIGGPGTGEYVRLAVGGAHQPIDVSDLVREIHYRDEQAWCEAVSRVVAPNWRRSRWSTPQCQAWSPPPLWPPRAETRDRRSEAGIQMEIDLVIDGRSTTVTVEPRELLGYVLRERVGCRGVHVACGEGVCGACTVMVDGQAVRSCLMLAVQAHGTTVLTVRGATESGSAKGLQEALLARGAVQCGYCTPGLIMSVLSLLNECPDAAEEEITEAVAGHLCRCTGYVDMVRAITDHARTVGNGADRDQADE